MSEERGIEVWNTVLGAVMKLPGARINRDDYLRKTLKGHVPDDVLAEAIDTTPARAGVSQKTIDKLSEGSIKWHRAGVSVKSAAAGVPGGFAVAAAIPADLTLYFYHAVIIIQKLAYLHGWPQLVADEDEIDDESKWNITLFIGVMMGVQGANQGLTSLAQAVAKQMASRLPKKPLTKYAVYQIAKQVAKWIGIRLTKKKFAELLGRAIPIVGGVVAGSITWFAFGSGSKRLHEHLKNLPLATGMAVTI